MNVAPSSLHAIDTEYRGYRFRSRTEARYAVLFDAAGIDWQYEPEGFELNGTRYLPDFYLPSLETYVEVKPTKEAAEQAAPLLLALMEASGRKGMSAVGSPAAEFPPYNFFRCDDSSGHIYSLVATECLFCSQITLGDAKGPCRCLGDVKVLRRPWRRSSRMQHALGEAQRARFEFGETGKPRPYTPPPATHKVRVYAAGAIFRPEGPAPQDGTYDYESSDPSDWPEVDQGFEPWRTDIFHCSCADLSGQKGPTFGRFIYAGPTLVDRHGGSCPGLADECLDEVASAHALFAWIDREETVGTVAEVGAASARRKPIFLALANEGLAKRLYFIKQLATVAVITADVKAAWNLFACWQKHPA